MRVVIQRVLSASVSVEGSEVSRIGKGMLVLVGCTHGDTQEDAEFIKRKILNCRLWNNEEGKSWATNVTQNNFEILLVSQFTLYGILKGNKPDFHGAMPTEEARELYSNFVQGVKSAYVPERVQDGVFGAYMQVALENDGPVTIYLDSKERNSK